MRSLSAARRVAPPRTLYMSPDSLTTAPSSVAYFSRKALASALAAVSLMADTLATTHATKATSFMMLCDSVHATRCLAASLEEARHLDDSLKASTDDGDAAPSDRCGARSHATRHHPKAG